VWLCQKVQYTSAAPFLNVRLNDWLKFLQYLCTLQIQLIFAIYMMNYLCTGQKRMGKILQLNFNIFRTRYIMLTTMLRKILMIKELYKTETVLLSVYIHSVSTCFQSNVCKWSKIGTKWLQKLKSIRKCAMYIDMIKTHAAHHQQFQSFVATLFVWIHPASFILNHLWVSFFVTRRQDLLDFAGFTGFATLVSVVYVPV